MILFLSS